MLHKVCVFTQVDVMKSNVDSRVKAFKQEVEKFTARWHQLKPGADALEGDQKKCLHAVQTIKEKREEFQELIDTKHKLMWGNLW